MTDTQRAHDAMMAKAQRARDEEMTLRTRGYAHTTEAKELLARAQAFEEAAAMVRHPAMAARTTP
jgi:hypothetical protein